MILFRRAIAPVTDVSGAADHGLCLGEDDDPPPLDAERLSEVGPTLPRFATVPSRREEVKRSSLGRAGGRRPRLGTASGRCRRTGSGKAGRRSPGSQSRPETRRRTGRTRT